MTTETGSLDAAPADVSSTEIGPSALALDGWLAWNEERWGLTPLRVCYGQSAPDRPRLEGVLYLTRRGRVRMPPRNPYLPFRFCPSATARVERRERQWLELCSEFAEDLRRRGLDGPIQLSPGLLDARPLQWLGFEVALRYTYVLPLPWREAGAPGSIRKAIRRARQTELTVDRSERFDALHECLEATEADKSFSHETPPETLERLHLLLGPEHFHAFAARDACGRVVSALLTLHVPQGTLIGWSAGTLREFRSTGVAQLAYQAAIHDASEAGARQFDMAGANIRAVASAKAQWGAPLVPYLEISDRGTGATRLARSLVRAARALTADVRLGRRSARDRRPGPGGA